MLFSGIFLMYVANSPICISSFPTCVTNILAYVVNFATYRKFPDIYRRFPDSIVPLLSEKGLNGEIVAAVGEAVQKAVKNASAKDVVFIGGSTYVVAEMK
jgi:dihydrofolate synthase/folylpolyglutamate synthase